MTATHVARRLRAIASELESLARELESLAREPAPEPLDERAQLVADIRRRLPIVRIGYPEIADPLADALDRLDSDPSIHPSTRRPGADSGGQSRT